MKLAAILFAIVLIVGCASARAQDHHPLHRDFYRHWKAPDNPTASCCDARMAGPFGGEIGDCEPTQARVVDGRWQAWVRQTGVWIAVPDEKIIREPNPNIFDAHLCWTPQRGVICFKPPDTGG